MALDRLQDPHGSGKIGRAVVHENGAAEQVVAQNAPRPHHPADVGEPEEAVVRAVVERQPDFLAHLRQASGMGVDGALGFARGARGVQNEGAGFRIERQRRRSSG